jgi:alginate O-acetyltransferase complex protein AlgI
VVFSSIAFLFYFLPATIALHYIVPNKYRVAFLCFASLVFYVWAVGYFVFVLLAVAAVCWFAALRVGKVRSASARSALIALSLFVVFGVLAWFKYANFFVEQYNFAAGALSLVPVQWQAILLPAGISFFTFHAASYVIDVSKREAEPFSNPIDLLFYLVFFPHLIAGPIVRFHEIATQIRSRTTSLEQFATGASLLMWGLIKKVLVADTVAVAANAVFAPDASGLTSADVIIGTLAYTVQIYFDFSGYTSMAIGLALMFGFRFPQNFRRPYSAVSVTDFWRRWHITLSNWFRDYLYFPLGGNRRGAVITYRNLMIVFLATGIWHGANWTFLLWGMWHGAWLVIERMLGLREVQGAVLLRRAATLCIVMGGWILFRAVDVQQAADLYATLGDLTWSITPRLIDTLNPWTLTMLAVGVATFLLPPDFDGHTFLFGGELRARRLFRTAISVAVVCVLFPLALFAVISSTYSAFLYFQF